MISSRVQHKPLKAAILAAVACVMIWSTACVGGLGRDELVKPPDAAMLIIDGRGYVNVAVYDGSSGELVEYGSVNVAEMKGLTVWAYDWAFLNKDQSQ